MKGQGIGLLRKATTALILAVFLVGIATATAVPARATPPAVGGGTFDLSIPAVTTEVRSAPGDRLIVHVQGGGGLLFGTFQGTWIIQDEWDVVHLKTGIVTINGAWDSDDVTVDGVPGTVHVQYRGTADAATGEFQGRFRIVSGTGGLANLRGQGTVWVDALGVGGYTLQYHFGP